MAMYHVNNDLEVGRCTADEGRCPFKKNPHSQDEYKLYKIVEKHLAEENDDWPPGLKKESDVQLVNETDSRPSYNSFEDLYDAVVSDELKEEGIKQQELLDMAMMEGRNLTDAEMDMHEDYVEKITSVLREAGGETSVLYADKDGYYMYTKEREKQQEELLVEVFESKENVPNEAKTILACGMAGAGKSSMLRVFSIAHVDDYVSINPDDFKEEMAKKGMIPKVPGLLPMEASTLVHNEASELSFELLKRSLSVGKNVYLDQTLAKIQYTRLDLEMCKSNGYTIDAIFVDVPPEVSAKRAKQRYRDDTNRTIREGRGLGGRPVPKFFSKSQVQSNNSKFNSVNAKNFAILSTQFKYFTSKPRIFDNSVDNGKPREKGLAGLSRVKK